MRERNGCRHDDATTQDSETARNKRKRAAVFTKTRARESLQESRWFAFSGAYILPPKRGDILPSQPPLEINRTQTCGNGNATMGQKKKILAPSGVPRIFFSRQSSPAATQSTTFVRLYLHVLQRRLDRVRHGSPRRCQHVRSDAHGKRIRRRRACFTATRVFIRVQRCKQRREAGLG